MSPSSPPLTLPRTSLFQTRYSHVVAAADEAKHCLQEAVPARNPAKLWWWQRKVRLVDESAVRKVA